MKQLRSIGADLLRSIYMNLKSEDRSRYPRIHRREIVDRMHANIASIIEKASCVQDSGSDSDPEAGELKNDDKPDESKLLKSAGATNKTSS